jgi:hypothetical protein
MVLVALVALFSDPSLMSAQDATRPFHGFTPGACYWVPRMIEQLARREQPDTTAYNPAKDSTLPLARDSVRYCATTYAAPVPTGRLLDESRVQLIMGADSAALAATRRYLATLADSSVERRAWALHLIVDDNARARPRRMKAASDAVAELDKLGPKSARASVLAHMTLAETERDRWDDSAATAEASTAIVRWKTLAPDAALDLAALVGNAFLIKAEIALRNSHPDAARAVIDTAMRMLPSLAMSARRQLDAARRLYANAGKKAPPIAATHWFNAPDASAVRPLPGKVSIITEALHYCGGSCRPRYRALARFTDRFRERGLEVINFTKTVGFYRDTAPVTAADEAKYDSTYFFVTRPIPGSLAVYETKYRWLPDGRRVNEPTPQEQNYPLASLIIVDRRGIIRYVALGWDPSLEEPLAKLIERLLSE